MERYAKEGLLLGAVVVNGLAELGDSPDLPLGYFQSLEFVNPEIIQSFSRGVAHARPKVVWVDVRTEDTGKKVEESLRGLGFRARVFQVSGRTLGDQSGRDG